jgi:hypothetical protein
LNCRLTENQKIQPVTSNTLFIRFARVGKALSSGNRLELIEYTAHDERSVVELLAFDAVAYLRNKGLKARRLEDGFPEWKTADLPVDVRTG